ncbi:MAG: alpha/beta hydrolase [Phycisphaeraceae bacterium]|nr:MAG: alpha/beta hydrolase [Phycisphaeraceae bacterium]
MRMLANRREAALELAEALAFLEGEEVVVMALPTGGVPIAIEICKRLRAPLDVLLLAKLHAPRMPDQVAGAVDEHGRISLIESAARWHHLTTQKMIAPARAAFRDLQRRRSLYRALAPEQEVRGRTVIIVDEGIDDEAATMLAAVASVRDRGAKKVVVAAPAGSEKGIWQLHETAHMAVIPHKPSKFRGIDKFYADYTPLSDSAVLAMLRSHALEQGVSPTQVRSVAMRVLADGERFIYCEMDIPPGEGPFPAVVFAHGFESDCRSPRSVPTSMRLAKRGVLGVRMDFMGHGRSEGDRDACTREVMLRDLQTVYESVRCDERVDPDHIGLCGSGVGGLVALEFASREPRLGALVIRGPICGGEVDAASAIKAPTLLIHGESDKSLYPDVARINELLGARHRLLQIPESNRLFSDPISFELMVNASVDWLVDYLKYFRPVEPPSEIVTDHAATAAPVMAEEPRTVDTPTEAASSEV